jgi:cell division protease FtsH
LNSTLKTLLLWTVIFVMVVLLWNFFQAGKVTREELSFSEFLDAVEAGRVAEVTISGSEINGKLGVAEQNGDTEFFTRRPDYDGLVTDLRASDVTIRVEEEKDNLFLTGLFSWFPILLIIGLWIFFMRQMQSGGNRALSFGKSKAKLLNASGKKVTFKDVAGVEEAKEELSEIVEFLRDPQKFQKLGGKIPKGVLLMGPPGTGKTLLARAIAGEANVPFFSISGSDFVEMFVGVGASRVRDLFEQGKKNAPCIIFIDEIDAVGRHRGAGLGGGHDEREQTLNQLLVEMDGFETNEGVILIAATNRPDVLDPALLRPGRFGILHVHTRTIPLADDVDLEIIARGTPGFAGADLANLVNEAALIAARRNQKKVDMDAFEYAKDKVLMGAERKTMMLTDEEKEVTAYHEGGHALVAAFLPDADPLHKITIIPRGRALGLTMQLPTEDKHTYKRNYVLAQLAILMGGRVAEELTQEDITTGAGNDIERATELARKMVCEWGMSELGPLSFGDKSEPVFIGRDFNQRADYSDDTALRIDSEIQRIVQSAYEQARALLTEHRNVLDSIAHELLEYEVLDGQRVYSLIERMTGRDLVKRPRPVAPASRRRERDQASTDGEGQERTEHDEGRPDDGETPAPEQPRPSDEESEDEEAEVAAARRQSTASDPLRSSKTE